MESFNHGRTSQQFRFLRRQFLQDGKLPFTNVLTVETITHALEKIDKCRKDRIYTPLVTLWGCLGQVLCAEHSCRAAVYSSSRILCRRETAPVVITHRPSLVEERFSRGVKSEVGEPAFTGIGLNPVVVHL